MQRPILDPTFMADPEPAKSPKSKRKRFAWVWKAVVRIWSILFLDPLGRRNKVRIEDGKLWERILRSVTYRLALVPVLLVTFLVALILAATHPGRTAVGAAGNDAPGSLAAARRGVGAEHAVPRGAGRIRPLSTFARFRRVISVC